MSWSSERKTVRGWRRDLDSLSALIAPRFSRSDLGRRAKTYLRGLLGSARRKNSWQLAEDAGDESPYGVQHLLGRARWDAEAVRDDLREYVVENFGDQAAVLIVDETGFLKKGERSCGVQRQYSGTAGRTENCQIGVFLCYASKKGAAFVDRELYLPKSWTADDERRAGAGIPDEVNFATKPQLARAMLERAFEAGVRASWVSGDSIYGGDRRLRMFLEAGEQPFVLAVKRSEPLWATTDRGPAQIRADGLAERAAEEDWHRLSAGAGSKGERLYDWALLPLFRLQVTEEERRFEHLLLVRRGVEDADDLAYHVVFAPRGTPLEDLVRVAGERWRIESCFEAAKGEVGLGHYEVRSWHGWKRHVTLALFAHALLATVAARALRQQTAFRESRAVEPVPLTVPEVRRLLWRLVLARKPPTERVLGWSYWRRCHQARAKRCHYQRRAALHGGRSRG
ncbi:MAG: IS701 family transposase [Actinobacteria bacterium]|nr:IS701 family transposase [Actinomycetota bacterium]